MVHRSSRGDGSTCEAVHCHHLERLVGSGGVNSQSLLSVGFDPKIVESELGRNRDWKTANQMMIT